MISTSLLLRNIAICITNNITNCITNIINNFHANIIIIADCIITYLLHNPLFMHNHQHIELTASSTSSPTPMPTASPIRISTSYPRSLLTTSPPIYCIIHYSCITITNHDNYWTITSFHNSYSLLITFSVDNSYHDSIFYAYIYIKIIIHIAIINLFCDPNCFTVCI